MTDATTRSATDPATARTVDGWERRRERVAREIERVGLELYARSGPEAVTVEEIAAAAGISNRTFFRYFSSRDEILAALPRRYLELLSTRLHERPRTESIIEAFAAAEEEIEDPAERELVLLWGIVVHRSPDVTMRAMAHSAVDITQLFQALIAERLDMDADDPRAGSMGAAMAGVVAFAFRRWVDAGGRISLANTLVDAFTALADLGVDPVPR